MSVSFNDHIGIILYMLNRVILYSFWLFVNILLERYLPFVIIYHFLRNWFDSNSLNFNFSGLISVSNNTYTNFTTLRNLNDVLNFSLGLPHDWVTLNPYPRSLNINHPTTIIIIATLVLLYFVLMCKIFMWISFHLYIILWWINNIESKQKLEQNSIKSYSRCLRPFSHFSMHFNNKTVYETIVHYSI